MKTFVAVMCFSYVALTAAKPGYNYQESKQVVKQTVLNSAPISTGGFVSVQQSQPLTSFNVQAQPQFVSAQPVQYTQTQFVGSVQPHFSAPAPVQQFAIPAPQYVAPVQQQRVVSSSQYQQPQQQTIVNKQIFIHSAPEETEVIGEQKDIESAPIHKNYRIVFIKAPAQNIKLNVESLKRAQSANEEKTVIYVLSKKPDLAKIQTQLINVQNEQKTQKPEVYFIKYKTQEEANRAQQEIQAQYDALGGSTRVSDEGIAPITSVIGSGSSATGSNFANVGSATPSFVGASSINVGSVAPTFVTSGSNFVQSVGGEQQQVVKTVQTVQTTQTAGSSKVSLPADVHNNKYLPIIKKKI